MKRLLLLSTFLFVANMAFAVNYTVTNQTEWDAVPVTLLVGDTVFIEPGTVITNMGGLGRSILGTIVNHGDFTMNAPGIAIQDMEGTVLNYGTFTIGNAGLALLGDFFNIGTLNVNMAAIVVMATGNLYNTGTVNNNVDIANSGAVFSCDVIGPNSVNGIAPSSSVPAGTPCDDGDDMTENDEIISSDPCVCEGTSIIEVPTMGQWGLGILSLFLAIFGIVTVRQRMHKLA